MLSGGDRLSFDARLVSGAVEVEASPLTGESQPVYRRSERLRRVPWLLESEGLVLSGTLVTAREAAALLQAPPLQAIFGITALGPRELAILATFRVVVWGWDDLVRRYMRRRDSAKNYRARSGAAYGQS